MIVIHVDELPISTTTYTNGETAHLFATQSYILRPGFHARAGSTVNIRIDPSGGNLLQGDYDVSNLTYDANGNIQNLRRNKSTEDGGNAMDDLAYEYDADRPNRLLQVRDAAGDVENADDIADQPNANNYEYNAIGQLIRNNEEDIAYFYNASGLVTQVDQGGQAAVKFFYTLAWKSPGGALERQARRGVGKP